MRVEQKGLCRGSGKIFVLYDVESSRFQDVRLSNTTKDGKFIPSKLISVQFLNAKPWHTSYVAVLPNLPINQYLTFTSSISADGSVHENGGEKATKSVNKRASEKATKVIRFEVSKWESRYNYRRNKEITDLIRNYDELWHEEEIAIYFPEMYPCGKAVKVRASLRVPEDKLDDLEIKVYSSDMTPLTGKIIDMGSRVFQEETESSVLINDCRISFDVPDLNGTYLIDVMDNKHPEYSSFAVLDPAIIKEGTGKWWVGHVNAAVDQAYSKWFGNVRTKAAALRKQSEKQFALNPKFSIIVPLYKTPIPFFDDMAASVVTQTYANWELVLVNASPEDEALANRAADLAKLDERVKIVTLDENLGIALNTRAGIDAASGDYICFFDHDDLLEPDILFEYALAINDDPKIDLLYCDEDKLMPNGKLGDPYFKPDFSIDLLRNNNYICHLLCIKKTLLDTLEPSPKDVDGSQDHDLTLKAVEKTTHVHHVPKVLYHWRIHANSTAAGGESKPYAMVAGVKAVQRHLDRLGIDAEVRDGKTMFTYDVEYKVQGNPLVSIIIPTKDESSVLRTCIDSIKEKSTYDNYEIVIVENNSAQKETFDYYEELKRSNLDVKIVEWRNPFNFSKLINIGVEHAKGDYLLFLNNDTEVITPNWIERMLGFCQRKDVGIVGARLWYPDDVLQHGGVALTMKNLADHINLGLVRGDGGYFAMNEKVQNMSAVTGACMMTKRSVFDSVGGMDEELAVAYNDIDYCLKVREEGFEIVYTPYVELYHYESLSRGVDADIEGMIRYERERSLLKSRWIKYFAEGDPFYSKNFSQLNGNYQMFL